MNLWRSVIVVAVAVFVGSSDRVPLVAGMVGGAIGGLGGILFRRLKDN
jgi:hypothetical protein